MSDIDFFQIGALKDFADIGALIEEDESKQFKFMDLPIDIIQNNILNHLLSESGRITHAHRWAVGEIVSSVRERGRGGPTSRSGDVLTTYLRLWVARF